MKGILKTSCLILFSSVLFGNCKKDKQSEITLEYPVIFVDNFEIDTLGVDSFIIRETIDFPTALDGELAKNNTNKSKIKSAKLLMLRMQVLDYAWADSNKYSNFRDFSDIILDFKNDVVGQKTVATKTVADIRTKAINLDPIDVEGKEFLQQDNFRMVFKYKKRRKMYNEMPFIISVKFKIVADPL